LLPDAEFLAIDLRVPQSGDAWQRHLQGVEAVVNAAGALQTGGRDDVEAVHHRAIAALVRACEAAGVERFVQISSVGVKAGATTEFLRSKARGDECVSSSSLSWVVVRPGLVIGPSAYGGTALIRMLASIPLVQASALAEARVQTVAVSDLSAVVLDAVEGRLPGRVQFDLVEQESHSLRDVIGAFRRWLGFPAPRLELRVPRFVLGIVARIADALGHLGWRSPLRTTTLRVLAEGVLGDPAQFARVDARKLSSLHDTLSALLATVQEKWFARLNLAMPVTVAVLSLFWVMTGIIALLHLDVAARMAGLGVSTSRAAVVLGSIVDIGLGVAVLYRPWAKGACLGMAFTTVVYLAMGSALRPELWADPLGPLLKAVPVLMLTLIAALLLDDR
jgi:uncharacterized protein YbjT (DUF2867 family)